MGLRLQLLLDLASAVILRSESRGTHDHILLSPIRDSPNLEVRSPYLYPPGTGWPGYSPRHWVPFSSPSATRRATVEKFEPTSTRDNIYRLAHLVTLKSSAFWDITPCIPLKVNRCLRGTCRLYLQGRRISQARNQHARRWQTEGWFLAGLILRP
jgi:hypothetical protein